MPRRWRVLPELFKYISEFCIFFSPWYFPPRSLYRIQDPKNRHLFRPFLLFYSSFPPSSLYNIQLSYRHALSSPKSWVCSSCPLDYYTFLFRIFVLLVCYSHPPGTLEGPRSFHAFIQSPCPVSPPKRWTLTPDPFISPASSLPLISFYPLVSWDSPLTASSAQPTSIDHTK